MNITATDLKQRSGQVLDDAQRDPVKIVKHGRIYGAVISRQDLELLENTKKLNALKNSVQAGFKQIENGQYSTRNMDDIFQEVLEKRKTKGSSIS